MRFVAAKAPIPLPDVGNLRYMVEAFMSLGFGREEVIAGMKVISILRPQTWQEVDAFARATCAIVQPWEHEALIAMSRAYCREYNAAADPFRIAPSERKLVREAELTDSRA